MGVARRTSFVRILGPNLSLNRCSNRSTRWKISVLRNRFSENEEGDNSSSAVPMFWSEREIIRFVSLAWGLPPSGCQVRDVFCVFIITISSNITSITTSNTTIIANTTMIMDIIIINIIIPISLNRCVCPLFLLHKDLLVCFWLGLFLFSAGFVSSLICTDVEVGSQVEICYVPPFSIINHPSTEWANWTSFVLVNPLLIANIFGFFLE